MDWKKQYDRDMRIAPQEVDGIGVEEVWELGGIIIVAKGSRTPLILRRFESHHLFVGGCWLIDKQLGENFHQAPVDPGFSNIMTGSVWDEIGKGRQEEEFYIL
jgi:hypothetical protein